MHAAASHGDGLCKRFGADVALEGAGKSSLIRFLTGRRLLGSYPVAVQQMVANA